MEGERDARRLAKTPSDRPTSDRGRESDESGERDDRELHDSDEGDGR